MQKKSYFIFLLLIFMLLSAGAVYGQSSGGVLGTITNNSLVQKLFGNDNFINDTVFMRILFATLVGIALYGISSLAMGQTAPGIRVAISIVVGILVSAVIPSSLLVAVAGLWGGSIVAIFMLLPILGGLWLIFKTFEEPTRFNYITKAILSLVMYTLTTNADAALPRSGGTLIGAVGLLSEIFGWLTFAFFLMAIYYAIRIFGATEGGGAAGDAREMISRNWRAMQRTFRIGYRYERDVAGNLNQLRSTLPAGEPPLTAREQRFIDGAHRSAERSRNVLEYARRLEARLQSLPEGTNAHDLERRLTASIAAVESEIGNLAREIEALRGVTNANAEFRRHLASAIAHGNAIERHIVQLEAMERQIERHEGR